MCARRQAERGRDSSQRSSLSSAFRLPETAGTAAAAVEEGAGSLAAGLASEGGWAAAAAGASLAGEVSDLAKEEQELNSPERGRGDRPTDRTTDRARGEHGKINSEKIGRHGQERGWRAAEAAAVLPERERAVFQLYLLSALHCPNN